MSNVELSNSVKTIGTVSMQSCAIDDEELTEILQHVSVVEDNVFRNCVYLKNITIPSNVTEIGGYCFASSENLKNSSIESVTFENGITKIWDSSFAGCTQLKTINIPSTVDTIGAGAFSECTALESVIIPQGVSIIEPEVFMDCTNLKSITLPSTITSIETSSTGTSAFTNIHEDAIIYVPNETVKALVEGVVGDSYTVTVQQ